MVADQGLAPRVIPTCLSAENSGIAAGIYQKLLV